MKLLKQRLRPLGPGRGAGRRGQRQLARDAETTELRPAVQPKIEITSFDDGADLEYTMAVELMPEIEPMDFAR